MSLTAEKLASGISVLAGLWFIAAPFWFGATPGQLWSDIVSGIVVACLAAYNLWLERNGTPANERAATIAGLLGLWMIVSPFVSSATPALRWSAVVGGVIVACLGAYNVYDAETLGGGTTGERSTGV